MKESKLKSLNENLGFCQRVDIFNNLYKLNMENLKHNFDLLIREFELLDDDLYIDYDELIEIGNKVFSKEVDIADVSYDELIDKVLDGDNFEKEIKSIKENFIELLNNDYGFIVNTFDKFDNFTYEINHQANDKVRKLLHTKNEDYGVYYDNIYIISEYLVELLNDMVQQFKDLSNIYHELGE